MAALTGDIKIIRYGTPGNSTQPTNLGITANATVYRGSIAITRSGYLVPASTPTSTDITWGLIDAGPGFIDGTPGILGGTSNGAVTAEIATGSFFLANGTGSDAITQANVGANCYVINETTVGASSAGTRPVAGVILGLGANLGNVVPFSALIAVHVGSNASTGGPS
jgi:hypothetical protein